MTSDVKSRRRPNSTEHVTSSSRLSTMTVDPPNVDQSRREWRRKMTNTVDSKVTPNDSWLDDPLLFLLTDECQVPPDRNFRSDTPMMIIRKFNNLKPMTLTVTLKHDLLAWPWLRIFNILHQVFPPKVKDVLWPAEVLALWWLSGGNGNQLLVTQTV